MLLRRSVELLLLGLLVAMAPASSHAQSCVPLDIGCGMGKRAVKASERLPGILVTEANKVPACVTPERLMRFLARRRAERFGRPVPIEAAFAKVADAYAVLGGRLGIRWDIAFFQMMYETGHLSFTTWSRKRNRWAEATVRPEQMNFAGLGATIENPVGESFPSLEDGVLFHLKHLQAYGGVMPQEPTANRTCLVKAEIVACARSLGRPVSFTDMTDMWAHNARENRYAQTLRSLARAYGSENGCGGDYPGTGSTGKDVATWDADAFVEPQAAAFGASDAPPDPPRPAEVSRSRRER